MGARSMPVINPKVKHVGVRKLRELNATRQRLSDDTWVIQDRHQPLAVLLTYDRFMEMQLQLNSLLNTTDLCQEKDELTGLKAAMEDLKAGRVRSLAEINAELAAKK